MTQEKRQIKPIIEQDNVQENEDNSVTITLKYPFSFEAEKITTLKLRRPKYKETKHSRTLKEDAILDYFLTTLSEQSPDLIDEIDPVDITTADSVVLYFLGIAAS